MAGLLTELFDPAGRVDLGGLGHLDALLPPPAAECVSPDEYAERVAAGEWLEEGAGLVPKKITVKTKTGKEYTRTVMVRPADTGPSAKDRKAADREAAHAHVRAALADPSALTHDDVPALVERMKSLTVDQLAALKKERGVKGGTRKQDVIDRLTAHARAHVPGATPPGSPGNPAVSRPADPKGFKAARLGPQSGDPKANAPSTMLPTASRPALTENEVYSLRQYSAAAYGPLNADLRAGGAEWSDPGLKQTHENLQRAFAKAPPLPRPVVAYRGADLAGVPPGKIDKFLSSIRRAAKTGGTVTLPGYTSTTTNAQDEYARDSQVVMKITARHGLDMKPYSKSPAEWELLLNHGSKFKVTAYHEEGGRHFIEMEQVP